MEGNNSNYLEELMKSKCIQFFLNVYFSQKFDFVQKFSNNGLPCFTFYGGRNFKPQPQQFAKIIIKKSLITIFLPTHPPPKKKTTKKNSCLTCLCIFKVIALSCMHSKQYVHVYYRKIKILT